MDGDGKRNYGEDGGKAIEETMDLKPSFSHKLLAQ
jgi:hypothetical protein